MLFDRGSRYKDPTVPGLCKVGPNELDGIGISGEGKTAESAGICDLCLRFRELNQFQPKYPSIENGPRSQIVVMIHMVGLFVMLN